MKRACPIAVAVAVALAAAVAPGRAAAQEAVEVPSIEVVGDPVARPDAPASARADRVDDPAALDAPEGPAAPAARMAAVQVLSQGGPGQAAAVAVRGTDPAATLAMLDGVPLNSPFLGGADLGALSLVTLDTLDVVRGGQSARHGTDAVGGVVAARTPDPLDGPDTRASLMLGSFSTARLKASHAHVWAVGPHDVGLRVGGGLLASDGGFPFTDTNGVDRVRTHNGSLAFEGLARAAGRIAGGHRVDGSVEGGWSRRQIAGLEQYPSTTANQRDSRVVVRAGWEGPRLFGQAGWTRASAFWRRLGFAYRDDAPPTGPATATTLIAHGIGVDAATEGALHPWVALGAGLSATHDAGSARRLGGRPGDPSRSAVAGRIGGRFGPASGPFEATVDLRVSWDQGFGVRPIPAVGMRWDPWGPIRLFANASRGFRLPTLEELHFDAGFVQGNPDLDPEDALTWDAGLELGHGRPWGLSAAYFENRVRNLILFLPRSAFLVRAENSGGATIRGVEAQGRWAWRWFDVAATYTFLEARFDATGLRMPQRPAHAVRGSVAATVGPVALALMPGWQSAVFLDRFEALTEEGRFRLDARLDWAFSRLLTLSLDAMNLTDKRDAVDHLQRPLPGMSFFLTMRLRR